MPDESDIGVIYCHVSTIWNPDYAFDYASFHDDAVDSAMLAIRCYKSCMRCFLYDRYKF